MQKKRQKKLRDSPRPMDTLSATSRSMMPFCNCSLVLSRIASMLRQVNCCFMSSKKGLVRVKFTGGTHKKDTLYLLIAFHVLIFCIKMRSNWQGWRKIDVFCLWLNACLSADSDSTPQEEEGDRSGSLSLRSPETRLCGI